MDFSHSLTVSFVHFPTFWRLKGWKSWSAWSREKSGGDWDFNSSPLISTREGIKGRKGSLIKRHVSNPLSGWEEMFLMKCNTFTNWAATLEALYTFQRNICMNFKCRISQVRAESSWKWKEKAISLCDDVWKGQVPDPACAFPHYFSFSNWASW